jgi:hypothetical protein
MNITTFMLLQIIHEHRNANNETNSNSDSVWRS